MIKQKVSSWKSLVVAIAVIFIGHFVPAEAANLTVNTLNDEQNVNGNCSLREAIINANSDDQSGSTDCLAGSGADTISFSVTGEITLGSDMPSVSDSDGLTLAGPGALSLAINGNGHMIIHNSAQLAISGLTLKNGTRGISNTGTITNMTNLIVTGNSGGGGAGVLNNGTITTMTEVTISGNTASSAAGGGLFNTSIITTMTNVTISGNTASSSGGGLFNRSDGTITTMTNVTISGNTTAGVGGGISNQGTITNITNVTISGNASSISGGGLFNSSTGTLSLRNTIVANNTSGGNCGADVPFTSNGYNLSSDNSCTLYFTATGDLNNTIIILGPLADNGGLTFTHALLAGSPAIDTADPANFPFTDQRGIARQQGLGPDIGAYEYEAASVPTMNEWGLMIFMFIAGLGSIYYLRRQREANS